MKLLSVGDMSLTTRSGRHPFDAVQSLLHSKDILFGNLEVALTQQKVSAEKSVPLTGSPDNVKYLTEAGFDVVSVANNHILDAGIEGFNDTLETLHANGIHFIGGTNSKFKNSHCVVEREGIRFGFLAYYIRGKAIEKDRVSINRLNESAAIHDIQQLKKDCDHVILSLHWGTEKSFYPSPDQITLARRLIDCGASVILGHHPHVVQGIERYNGGLIAYSLGNFQFLLNPGDLPPNRDRRTNRSIILRLCLTASDVESYDVIPIMIDNDFVPRECTPEETEEMLAFVDRVSQPIIDGRVKSLRWFGHVAGVYLSETFRSFMIRIRKYGVIHLCIFLVWLVTPFVLKCYAGWVWQKLRIGRTARELP